MSNPRAEFDDATRWARRLRAAVIALLVGAILAVATPLAAEPRLRAGVVRRVRMTAARTARLPTPTAHLDVPFLRQEHALSCEAATVRMVLAYRGIKVSERDLLASIGVDPTSRRAGVWGDPEEAFVGNVDGIMSKTGYGVHAPPVARVLGAYRQAEILRYATPAVLARELSRGNPIIVWGFIPGRGKPLVWRTLGGKEVRAVDGEHTRVVIGYTGTTEQPTGFFLLDPIYGEQYWPVDRFVRNWEPFGQIGVVVY